MGNFKNIAETFYLKTTFTFGSTSPVCVGTLSYQEKLFNSTIHRVEWVESRGTVYKTPCIVSV